MVPKIRCSLMIGVEKCVSHILGGPMVKGGVKILQNYLKQIFLAIVL